MPKSWLRIAHRGASGYAPEHTRAAFELALAQKAEMVELDVQLTADEELVVLHDDTLDRTTSGRGRVREKTWEEIRQLDAGSWFAPAFAGERPLRLQDAFALLSGRAEVNVEVKGGSADVPVIVSRLLAILRETRMAGAVVISSFDWSVLESLRRADNQLRLGLLWHEPERTSDVWHAAKELAAYSVHPLWMLADATVVGTAHERGLRVYVWTVNESATMRELLRTGVDGVISDYPDRLWELAQG